MPGAPQGAVTGAPMPGMVAPPAVPGMSATAAPGAPGASNPGNRIDPGQMPRPLVVSAETTEFFTRSGNAATIPLPIEGTNYIVRDNGNASPRFMRPTLSHIPASGELLATSAIPFAVLVQPFAMQHELEEPVPVVDYGETGPMRCESCKAYVNPFFRFIEHGRRVVCNMCQHVNEVPPDFVCHLGHDGKRVDWQERPELCRGSVDFVAPSTYMVRPPVPPVFLFAIEVSAMAMGTGVTQAACAAVRAAIRDMPEKARSLVGVVTFDTTMQFYKFKRDGSAQVLVVPDTQHPFAPSQSGLLVPCAEFEEQVLTLLDDIPKLYAPGVGAPTCFGAVVHAGVDALKKHSGRLAVMACSLPGAGYGALPPRDGGGNVQQQASANGGHSDKDPIKLLESGSPDYKDIAVRAADANVPVDLYFCPQGYVDAATTMLLPRTTGGEFRLYAPWNGQLDYNELIADLRWSAVRPTALETVMRVRCSQGLQVSEYNGSFYQPTATDLDIAGIDSDKAVMVCLRHGDKLSEVHEACFQAAVLYTSVDGHRRIRIHTACYPVTSVLGNLYKNAELDCIYNYFARWAASMLMASSLDQTKEVIISQVVNVLLAYRKFCAASSSSGQLILPESMKLLPLYTLALIKSPGLRSRCPPDVRAEWTSRMATISAEMSTPYFHPRILGVSCLPLPAWDGAASVSTIDGVPELRLLPASSESLKTDSVYLIENGCEMFLHVGRDVEPVVLEELFGVRQIGDVSSSTFLAEKPNERSRQLHLLIGRIRQERRRFLRLRVTRTGDPLEHKVMSMMIEDRQNTGQSYVEFLCHVHRQIQTKNT